MNTGSSIDRHRAAVRGRLLHWGQERPGPGSVTWMINREIIVVAGWGRAILLQLAHPSVAAGVHHHSTFRGSLTSSLRRLRSTIDAMVAITFGDTEDAVSAAAGINAIHDRVRGQVPGRAHESYSAHDPGLQRWVHTTLLESIAHAYESLVAPLTMAQRDQYCAEATVMEPLLGMPDNWLARDWTTLDDDMRTMLRSGQLVVTDTSRALARAVLFPPNWRLAWPAFRAMQLFTIGSLPPSIREAYGFEWNARNARALGRWIFLLRLARRCVPSAAREWRIARRQTSEPRPFRAGVRPTLKGRASEGSH